MNASTAKVEDGGDMQFEQKLVKAGNEKPSVQAASERQEKFSEFLKTEKLRKYKRMPRVYN